MSLKIKSKQVKFIKEFDSSNGGNRSSISVSDFLELPLEVDSLKETKIYRCYDDNKKLLGEIRPKPNDELIDVIF